MKNTIIINGTVIQTNAKSISVVNGKVYIDGGEVEIDENQKQISIEVQGDIETIQADVVEEIKVAGCVKNDINTHSGYVKCGNVGGSVTTKSGAIDIAGSVESSASTQSGSIRCGGDIKGDARTMSGCISAGGSIGGSCSTMSGSIFGGRR